MRKTAFLIGLLLIAASAYSQILKPVKWSFESKKTAPNSYDLIFKASIEDKWHLYSQFLPSDDGPVKTSFTFNDVPGVQRIGGVKETSKVHTDFDKNFNMELKYFEKEAVFVQKVKLTQDVKSVKGTLNFMVCDDHRCLPPEDKDFSFDVKYEAGSVAPTSPKGETAPEKSNTNTQQGSASPFKPVEGSQVSPKTSGILKPVKWNWEAKKLSKDEYELIFTAKIDGGWHMYGLAVPQDGPQAAAFEFVKSPAYELVGKVTELTPSKVIDEPVLQMKLPVLEGEARFSQKIKLLKGTDSISGILHYSACDNRTCIPAQQEHFAFKIGKEETISGKKVTTDNGELWAIFFTCFLGGFAALVTPCVYPMIPLTVSFFIKKQKDRVKSIMNVAMFGFSIIGIYVGLGMIVTIVFGPNALNSMATNVYFNMLFFIMFIVFAASFLGAFEIQLPNSWVNKADQQSEKGGLIGIFFMAFTLVLISFSCTGPTIGPLLALAMKGGIKGPVTGMLGFSLAFAIPFMLFAMFPSWLNSLPKSGGWLNSVKVTFGLLELALALKFFSNADLAYHWGILKREYFIAIWIVVFTILGLYLLGKLKFSHDTDLPYISVPRLFFAILAFTIPVYLIPGLWGAPLNLLSGLLPPAEYVEGKFVNSSSEGQNRSAQSSEVKKYGEGLHCPHDLNCYFDYNQAVEVAKKLNKPIMLDFTGFACANCRRMESNVWADPKVLERLRNDFVLVSLYVDDKKSLDKEDVYFSKFSNKEITTIGDKWSDLQAEKFNNNTQPYYVLVDHNGNVLTDAVAGYDPDIDKFVNFLEQGKNEYKKRQANP